MKQGFKATLFAGVITFGVMAPAFAAAPVITDIPDVTIGDLEGSTENNVFEYEAPFSLNDYVEYDGDEADLLWSFGESEGDGLDINQYTINGVGAAVSGDTALADEEASPSLTLNPAEPIDGSSSTTVYRDIVLSPAPGTGPFPDPSSGDAAIAAEGKLVTYFVSDGTNVASQQRLIKSVDNAADTLTGSEGWDTVLTDSDFTDWVPSGIQSEGVTITDSNAGQLDVTVTPTTGLGRVYGWQNAELLSYDDVGADKFLRVKFYISASNAMTAPINEVPNFRLRVFNTAAVDAAAHFEYAQTAFASPSHEPRYNDAANPAVEEFSKWLRPSDSTATPSLYRVDFDPVDVDAAEGTPIGALMESYSYNDTANGTLSLHEVVLGTYDALQEADGDLVFDYDAFAGGMTAGAGGDKEMTGGAFNAEANFEPGRRQQLWVASANDVPPSGGYSVNIDFPGIGVVATSRFASTDLFAMDLLNVQSIDNADRTRIEAGKLYKARFYAQGILPATAPADQAVQGPMRFRFQTAGGTVSYLYELIGAAGLGSLGSAEADAMSETAGPSKDSQNPDTDSAYAIGEVLGETPAGGWYNVIVSSPLSEDGIREDTEDFGDLAAAPGPGDSADSARDILLGVDLIQAPTHLVISAGGAPVPFNQPNHSEVGISAIKLYEFTDINDGGYDFDGGNL